MYVANEQFDRATAEEVIRKGEADAVAFGKLFIANPDLPRRLRTITLTCPAGSRYTSTLAVPCSSIALETVNSPAWSSKARRRSRDLRSTA